MPACSQQMSGDATLPIYIGGGVGGGGLRRSQPKHGGAASKFDFGAYLLAASPPVDFITTYGGMRSHLITDDLNNNNNDSRTLTHSAYHSYGSRSPFAENYSRKISAPDRLESVGTRERNRKLGLACAAGFYSGETVLGEAGGHRISGLLVVAEENNEGCAVDEVSRSCLRSRSCFEELSYNQMSPARRKKVSFADDLGYRLYVVRFFEETPDTPSAVNPAVIQRHITASVAYFASSSSSSSPSSSSSSSFSSSSSSAFSSSSSATPVPEESSEKIENRVFDAVLTKSLSRVLMPNFSMPASNYVGFRAKVETDFVSLESVHVSENTGAFIGTIKVKDIAYEKTVFVRCTFDNWATHTDIRASYVPLHEKPSTNSRRPIFATFSFRVEIPDDIRNGAHLAVCYRTDGREFWDNNSGANYELVYPDWLRSGSRMTCDAESTNKRWNNANSVVFSLNATELWTDFASWTEIDTSCPYY